MKASSQKAGFTLIELLVVIALLALLAGLIFAALGNARRAADREAATSQLRQVGIAINSYVADNNGFMPGPMWPGQIPIYNPARRGRLANLLLPFFQMDTPESGDEVDILIPPMYRPWIDANPGIAEPRTYVLNMLVEQDGEILNPWGMVSPSGNTALDTQPMSVTMTPGNAWAVSDADQLHPRVASAPWRMSTPGTILHGDQRLALTFSGSVLRIEPEALAIP